MNSYLAFEASSSKEVECDPFLDPTSSASPLGRIAFCNESLHEAAYLTLFIEPVPENHLVQAQVDS